MTTVESPDLVWHPLALSDGAAMDMLAIDGFDDQVERGVMLCVQRPGGRQSVVHEPRAEPLATVAWSDRAGRLDPVDDLGCRLVVDCREADHGRAVEDR